MMDFSVMKSRLQTKLRTMNVSYECLTPVVLLPAFIYIAAFSRELSILAFLVMPVMFCVLYRRYMQMQYRSRFFYVWSLWSIIFGYMLFQSTVPMMEVLPEENIIFLLCLVLTSFLFYKVRNGPLTVLYRLINPYFADQISCIQQGILAYCDLSQQRRLC